MDVMVADLEALARTPSQDHRSVLLRKLTDMFFRDAGRYDERIVAMFEDVVCRVLDEVDVASRADLADRLSVAPRAPRRLVEALACDEESVAEPVLRHAVGLSDALLIEVAAAKGPRHLAAIARRVFVAEPVAQEVIERASIDVQRMLVGNDGAQIGAAGYACLLARAVDDEVLQELLSLRENLPEAVRLELMPILADEVRRRLATRCVETAGYLIEDALEAEFEGLLERAAGAPAERRRFADLLAAVDDGSVRLGTAIEVACRLSRHDWVIDLLTVSGGIARPQALQALFDRDVVAISILLRALGAGASAFRAVLDLRARHLRVAGNDPRHLDDFLAMDAQVASLALDHVRRRSGLKAAA